MTLRARGMGLFQQGNELDNAGVGRGAEGVVVDGAWLVPVPFRLHRRGEHAERIVPGGNGMFRATIVDAGRVVGTWRHQGTGARRRVVAEPFGVLTARARAAVAAAGG